ncbi:MAG: hypothetical protein QOD28_2407, partial [Acidobacteriota bacterium]|nr:hypothetical protein [Acidobacteriota bacterium]
MSTEPEEMRDTNATEPQKERRGIRKGLYLIPSAFT